MNTPPKNQTFLTMGGKGGTGKTTVLGALAEYLDSEEIAFALLDLDSENKTAGSLAHFYPGRAEKVDVNTRAGLDILIKRATDNVLTLADMGAGSGKMAHRWFNTMHALVAPFIDFVAIGVVDTDPGSVSSVVAWSKAIGHKARYLIVLNAGEQEEPDFKYWGSTEAKEFIAEYNPTVINLSSRLPELQNALRNHGATLTSVAERKVILPELDSLDMIVRAQAAKNEIFAEFDAKVRGMLP